MLTVLERHLSKKEKKKKMTPAGTLFVTSGAQACRVGKEGLGVLQACWALLSVLPVH